VTVTNNGREALDAFEKQPFDLIFIDVQMPEMDGIEATRRIRRRQQSTGVHVPIIAPLMGYTLTLESEHPGRKVAVLLPELVVRHWWENLLHNQRVQLLKILLLVKGSQRIVVVNIPWYL
jgi:DNA-binding LytR/AlgR family response regulator